MRAFAAALAGAARSFAAAERAALEPLGLTPATLRLLDHVATAGPGSPSVAAAALGVARPTVTSWVKELEGRGLLGRGGVDGDARRAVLTLTPAGVVAHRAAIDDVRRRHVRLLAAAIDPNAQADLLEALGRIAGARS